MLSLPSTFRMRLRRNGGRALAADLGRLGRIRRSRESSPYLLRRITVGAHSTDYDPIWVPNTLHACCISHWGSAWTLSLRLVHKMEGGCHSFRKGVGGRHVCWYRCPKRSGRGFSPIDRIRNRDWPLGAGRSQDIHSRGICLTNLAADKNFSDAASERWCRVHAAEPEALDGLKSLPLLDQETF
jgi:hypothetical protein